VSDIVHSSGCEMKSQRFDEVFLENLEASELVERAPYTVPPSAFKALTSISTARDAVDL
jgi:hypothetical protein